MNDELTNNQDIPAKPANGTQVDVCMECEKNPCVCPNKNAESSHETTKKENYPRTKPPKLTWI